MRKEGDKDGAYYVYTLHDPRLTKAGFNDIIPRVDRQTKFKIFLSSMFYIGFGKDDRDQSHLKNNATKNPRKMDVLAKIKEKGCEVHIHRFSIGVNRDQGKYLEALSLRATRLGGNITNLKEEKPRDHVPGGTKVRVEDLKATTSLEQLLGTLVLWEASRTFGKEQEGVLKQEGALVCGLCIQEGSMTTFRTVEREKLAMHQKLRHAPTEMPVRKFKLASQEEVGELEQRIGVNLGDSVDKAEWLEKKMLLGTRDVDRSKDMPKEMWGKYYTEAEEHQIIRYILQTDILEKYSWSVAGGGVWRVMAEQGFTPAGRTWQSCKERFRRKILRQIARGLSSFPFTEEQLGLLERMYDYRVVVDCLAGAPMPRRGHRRNTGPSIKELVEAS